MNVKPDLVKWDVIKLLSHKVSKFIQTVTGKAADWYRICSSIFQQYVNVPYLILDRKFIQKLNIHMR